MGPVKGRKWAIVNNVALIAGHVANAENDFTPNILGGVNCKTYTGNWLENTGAALSPTYLRSCQLKPKNNKQSNKSNKKTKDQSIQTAMHSA
jgi:hypothetical protein